MLRGKAVWMYGGNQTCLTTTVKPTSLSIHPSIHPSIHNIVLPPLQQWILHTTKISRVNHSATYGLNPPVLHYRYYIHIEKFLKGSSTTLRLPAIFYISTSPNLPSYTSASTKPYPLHLNASPQEHGRERWRRYLAVRRTADGKVREDGT